MQSRRSYPHVHGAGADGTFNAESWLRDFTKASRTRNSGALSSLRVDIATDTVQCCEKLSYTLITGKRIPITTSAALQQAVTACEMHTLRELSASVHRAERFPATEFEVVEGDCLEAAIDLKLSRGLNPAVLNMASRRRPGGGYKHGAGAQEENLFRRSNYYQSLEDPQRIDAARRWQYPLRDFAGVYSPSVQVFRGAEAKGYEFMSKPVALDFIAVAAYSHPQLVTTQVNGKQVLRLAPDVAEKTKDKIRLILNIALHHKHDSLVLSAFGCGAFCNPPEHMAELFRGIIQYEYKACFKHISFAIFDDHNSRKPHNPQGNVLPFKRVFGLSTPADEATVAASQAASGEEEEEEEEGDKEAEVRPQRGGSTRGRGGAQGPAMEGGCRGRAGRQQERGRNARVRARGRGAPGQRDIHE